MVQSPTLSFQQGVKDCIPTLIGYISIGIAFGIVGLASNLSLLEVFLLSMFVYAGSAQFIFCGLYVASAPLSIIVLTVFIVNLRHFLMALSVAPFFKQQTLLQNIGYGTLLTDETFGVAITKANTDGKLSGSWMNGLNVTAYLVWIASCTFGGLIGEWIAQPERWGLDYALVAMFVALLVLTLSMLNQKKLLHALKLIMCMAVILYICQYFMASHIAIIIATVIVATIGVLTDR